MDASIQGLGTVLSQKQPDGLLHPLAYTSRSLSPTELNYSTSELETLAVAWDIQHFHAHVYGHQVTVSPITLQLRQFCRHQYSCNGKHARQWTNIFSSGVDKIDIVYRPDKTTVVLMLCLGILYQPFADGIWTILHSCSDFGEEQRKDPNLNTIIKYLEDKELPVDEKLAKQIMFRADHWQCNIALCWPQDS